MENKNQWKNSVETAWDKQAKGWSDGSRQMWDKGSRKDILPFCYPYFLEGTQVLDVGCGSGYSTSRLSELGFAVTGIDLSEEMIKLARQHYPMLPFQQGDINHLPFGKGQFSNILGINVLEWTASPKEALAEMSRVLTMGGYLCIGILGPTAGPRRVSFNRLLDEAVMMNTMMPWEFAELAEMHGFELVDQLIVDKKWGDSIHGELPIQARQSLSFMTVFILKKVE